MVERGIAWIVAGGNRTVRYRGVTKNNAWLHLRAAALNPRRLRTLGLSVQHGSWALAFGQHSATATLPTRPDAAPPAAT